MFIQPHEDDQFTENCHNVHVHDGFVKTYVPKVCNREHQITIDIILMRFL